MNNWEDVFETDGTEFINCVKNNREIYSKIKNSDYRSIKACVKYAINNGTNAAFAKYYIKFISDWKNRISSCVQDIKENLDSKKLSVKCIPLYKTWRKIVDEFYEEDSLYQFFENKNRLIERDAMIQLGFFLGYNEDEMNDTLQKLGYRKMYILDIVDVICSFFLNKNASEYDNYGDNKAIYENHQKCRDKIKEYLNKINSRESVIPDNDFGKPVFTGNAGEMLLNAKQIKGYEYIDNYKKLKKSLEDNDTKYKYITNVFHKKAQIIDGTDEKCFFELLEKHLIYFRQIYYTYYMMMARFLFDIDKMKKNLSYNNARLDINNCYEKIINSEEIADVEIKNKYVKICEKKDEGKIITINSVVELVNYVLNISDPTIPDDYLASGIKSKTMLMNHVQGRKKNTAYSLADNNKNFSIRLAIATGHEEDMGEFLVHGGFWSDNYMSKDMWTKSAIDRLDPTDIILQYSVQLREKLIESWTENEQKNNLQINAKAYKRECRKAFPFRKMTGAVCRDILFSALFMEEKLDDDCNPQRLDKFEQNERKQRIEEVYRNLIYPIKESSAYWVNAVKSVLDTD